jgi:type II secretory ATPase GspE/PulE/Tfp pilus assembly ATPase PilB-like protein
VFSGSRIDNNQILSFTSRLRCLRRLCLVDLLSLRFQLFSNGACIFALSGVIAQKLAQKLCIQCMEQYRPTKEDFDRLVDELGVERAAAIGIRYRDDLLLYRRVGCDMCLDTGYDGFLTINEILEVTPRIKSLVRKKSLIDATMISECAAKDGMLTLRQDAILKVFQGLTDLDELERVFAQSESITEESRAALLSRQTQSE